MVVQMLNFPPILESIKDLDRSQIDRLLVTASKIKKDFSSYPVLNSRPFIASFFLENSTRTKLGFAIAARRLGAEFLDFSAETSALKKGESLDETLVTLKLLGVDLCIIRSGENKILHPFKKGPPLKLINGGDGTHQHPTQALADLFTIKENFKSLNDITVTIMGDIRHSRVAGSLIDLLPLFGIKVNLCAPPEFLPSTPPPNTLIKKEKSEALAETEALYLLQGAKRAPSDGLSRRLED